MTENQQENPAPPQSNVGIIANTLMNLRPGVLMLFAGIVLVMMSATESWGALNVNPAMGSKLFDAGCVVFMMGAFFSWYRSHMEAQSAKDVALMKQHQRIERLEYIVGRYHGTD